MVNVNKRYLNRELRVEAWGRFLTAVHALKSPESLINNLRTFLTPSEIIMLEKRFLIPILAGRGLGYKAIQETLDVSPSTISFVKHNLIRLPAHPKQHRVYYKYPKKKMPRSHFLPPYKGARLLP